MANEQTANKHIGSKIIFIFLLVIMAFIAGICGEIFTRYYLSGSGWFRDLYFTDTSNVSNRDIIIQDPKKVVVEQELRLNQLEGEITPVIASIYSKTKTNPNLLDRLYLAEDYLGQAVILTSDGWLITTDNVLTRPKENIVLIKGKASYNIEKTIEDTASGITFIKINATNLPAIKIADWQNISLGQQVVAYNTFIDQMSLSTIQSKQYKEVANRLDFLSSTNNFEERLLLTDSLDRGFKGSPIVNLQGQVIAVLANQDQAILLQYIKPIINQVLKGEEIKRPYLGISYLNLAQVNGLSQEELQNQTKGVMIWADKTSQAIMADSPLNKILVAGDIIISIEGQSIDQNNDLSELIAEYKTGQQIRLKYLHEQKEQEITITL